MVMDPLTSAHIWNSPNIANVNKAKEMSRDKIHLGNAFINQEIICEPVKGKYERRFFQWIQILRNEFFESSFSNHFCCCT